MTVRKNKISIARFAGIMSIIFFFLAIFIASRIPSLIKEISLTSTASNLITATLTFAPTLFETPIPPLLPTEITDEFGVEMVLVPAGEFIMGEEYAFGDWDYEPVRNVYLDSFYIDKYEVTNELYKKCEDAGLCISPKNNKSGTRGSYYENTLYANYPVIHVDWFMAKAYCEWRGGNLPTEAQWEKSARGTDGRDYPWGVFGNSDICQLAHYNSCNLDTVIVGSLEKGKSIFGVYDTIGNVREWVADWYSDDYYSKSPVTNPLGPDNGEFRSVRGSGWDDADPNTYGGIDPIYYRYYLNPNESNYYTGFRCAKDATP